MEIGNALSGATTGASVGSLFGPVGTGIGALAGGALGLFGSKKKKKKTISTFDPQQQDLYNKYMQGINGQGQFADLYNFNAGAANQNFDANVARPANRNFQENIIPSITGQFRGQNLQNSSYLGESLGKAGRDVQEGLNAQRSNYLYQGEQAANQRRSGGIDKLLNTQTFAQDASRDPGSAIDQILNVAGPAAGEWFADYIKTKRG